MFRLTIGVLLALAVGTRAFAPPHITTVPRTALVLFAQEDDTITETTKKKGSLEVGVRSKLVAESIAPWRSLRIFLYGALGSGAAVGGIITLTGVAAALSGGRTDVDLNTEVRSDASVHVPKSLGILDALTMDNLRLHFCFAVFESRN